MSTEKASVMSTERIGCQRKRTTLSRRALFFEENQFPNTSSDAEICTDFHGLPLANVMRTERDFLGSYYADYDLNERFASRSTRSRTTLSRRALFFQENQFLNTSNVAEICGDIDGLPTNDMSTKRNLCGSFQAEYDLNEKLASGRKRKRSRTKLWRRRALFFQENQFPNPLSDAEICTDLDGLPSNVMSTERNFCDSFHVDHDLNAWERLASQSGKSRSRRALFFQENQFQNTSSDFEVGNDRISDLDELSANDINNKRKQASLHGDHDLDGSHTLRNCKRSEKFLRRRKRPSYQVPCREGQASYQRTRDMPVVQYLDLGDKTSVCEYCGALFWLNERLKFFPKQQQKFGLCCQGGKIRLPSVQSTPSYLDSLLDPSQGSGSVKFRKNVRAYNSMFAFTLMGARLDSSVRQLGPYIFKLNGQAHHLMGSLLPLDGECPKFCQLYVHDTPNEVQNRMNVMKSSGNADNIDSEIVRGLIEMFDETNELVRLFRTARDKFEENIGCTLGLRLLSRREGDDEELRLPTLDDIGGLIVGDIKKSKYTNDIVIECRSESMQRITKLHPKYMALQYPLLFPYGEDGYRPDIKLHHSSHGSSSKKRTRVSMRSFYAYRIQERKDEDSTLLKGGRLFQQFLVDAYAAIEEDRLDYIRKNQKNLRSEMYEGIHDAMTSGTTSGADVEGNKLASTILYSLETTISQRKAELELPQTGKPSWTNRLLLDHDRLCSKISFGFLTSPILLYWEEAYELCRTLEENEGNTRTASEMGDVLYLAMVLMAVKGVKVEEALEVLRKRFIQSGIEEKRSRGQPSKGKYWRLLFLCFCCFRSCIQNCNVL